MSKENTPEKTRKRTLGFVATLVVFLGTSIFAGINVLAAYQKNQDFSQLDAEDKFARLPEYLLNDRLLLKDRNFIIRNSTAKALGKLRSKKTIPELILLLEESIEYGRSRPNMMYFIQDDFAASFKSIFPEVKPLYSRPVVCSSGFGEFVESKELTYHLTSSIEKLNNVFDYDVSCIVRTTSGKLQLKESIPKLTESLKDSNVLVQHSIEEALNKIQSKKITHLLIPNAEKLHANIDTAIAFIESYENSYIAKSSNNLQERKATSRLIIASKKLNKVEQYKVFEGLISLDELNDSQIREIKLKVIKEIEEFDLSPDLAKKSLAIDISAKIYLKYNQNLDGFALKWPSVNQSRQIRDRQWLLTGSASVISLFLLLLTLFSLRQLQRIGWNDHLICYFPEEVVGELIALRRELAQANKSKLLIETKLLYEVITLIWGFYIQINIDNLSLPSKDQRRR